MGAVNTWNEFAVECFGFEIEVCNPRQAVALSENPRIFRNIEDFWRFKEIWGESVESYDNFQHDIAFHFLTAKSLGVDGGAVRHGEAIDKDIFHKFFGQEESPHGYLKEHFEKLGPHSFNQSRHSMMLAYLVKNLDGKWSEDVSNLSYAEIGGGFGSFVRLMSKAYGFKEWTIYDMPYVLELIDWFIGKNCPEVGEKVILIPTNQRDEHMLRNSPNYDVVIGTHSWSELSMNEHAWYVNNLLPRSRYAFYVDQASWPHKTSTMDVKRQRIEAHMDLIDSMLPTADYHCPMHFYKSKENR